MVSSRVRKYHLNRKMGFGFKGASTLTQTEWKIVTLYRDAHQIVFYCSSFKAGYWISSSYGYSDRAREGGGTLISVYFYFRSRFFFFLQLSSWWKKCWYHFSWSPLFFFAPPSLNWTLLCYSAFLPFLLPLAALPRALFKVHHFVICTW